MGPRSTCPCSRRAPWPRSCSTRWRSALAGERERYLRQQSELGGREVILSGRAGGAPGSPASAADDTAPERSAEGDVGSKGRSESKTSEAKWRKGAPGIPGEGIAVHSPDVAMVGDPLSGLDTLDEV